MKIGRAMAVCEDSNDSSQQHSSAVRTQASTEKPTTKLPFSIESILSRTEEEPRRVEDSKHPTPVPHPSPVIRVPAHRPIGLPPLPPLVLPWLDPFGRMTRDRLAGTWSTYPYLYAGQSSRDQLVLFALYGAWGRLIYSSLHPCCVFEDEEHF